MFSNSRPLFPQGLSRRQNYKSALALWRDDANFNCTQISFVRAFQDHYKRTLADLFCVHNNKGLHRTR